MPEQKLSFPSIKDVPASGWKKLAKRKIYFGHQSVGFNIVHGIKDVMRENPTIKLNIVETSNPQDLNNPIFAHSRIGKNVDPESKIDAFGNFMENGIGNRANIAFFKLCYVDITDNTDLKAVFGKYETAMTRLKNKYPQTTFVHVTVPLQSIRTSWKTWVKKLIGKKDIWEYGNNVGRNEFNILLRKQYGGKEPFFDLAKIESTHQNGSRSLFDMDGKIYSSLVPEYTYDGGHLNELGRKIVAEQLLIFLANLSE
jgi:hypothetical protein